MIPFFNTGKQGLEKSSLPRPRVIRPQFTNRKTLLVIVFIGVGKCINTLNPGETMNSQYYIEFVRKIGEKWRVLRSSPFK